MHRRAYRPNRPRLSEDDEFCVYPYLAEHYLATFTQEMLDAVNEHLSDEALERMGYERKTELPSWVTLPVLPSILPS